MRALVVEDGLSRQALAAARALRADGWSVGVGSPQRESCVSACSLAVDAWHRVEAAESSLSGFTEGVREAVGAGSYQVVFGARDLDVAALSHRREELASAIPYAAHERVIQAQDKLTLNDLASAAGFAVPETFTDLKTALEGSPDGTVIVKPRVGAALARGLQAGQLPGRAAAALATDEDAAQSAAQAIKEAGDDPIFQRQIRGGLRALVILADPDSHLVFCAQQEAVRTWPHHAGISVQAQTVPLESRLRERAEALVSALGWFGIAQLQLLSDGDEDYLIDFNGRFYGSLALMVQGGRVNLPAAWARMAIGEDAPRLPQPVLGARYQWLWGDLRRVMTDPEANRASEFASTLAYARGSAHSVASVRDPRPAARYLRLQLRRRLAKAGSG